MKLAGEKEIVENQNILQTCKIKGEITRREKE